MRMFNLGDPLQTGLFILLLLCTAVIVTLSAMGVKKMAPLSIVFFVLANSAVILVAGFLSACMYGGHCRIMADIVSGFAALFLVLTSTLYPVPFLV
jgi:hypothetical protein